MNPGSSLHGCSCLPQSVLVWVLLRNSRFRARPCRCRLSGRRSHWRTGVWVPRVAPGLLRPPGHEGLWCHAHVWEVALGGGHPRSACAHSRPLSSPAFRLRCGRSGAFPLERHDSHKEPPGRVSAGWAGCWGAGSASPSRRSSAWAHSGPCAFSALLGIFPRGVRSSSWCHCWCDSHAPLHSLQGESWACQLTRGAQGPGPRASLPLKGPASVGAVGRGV